MSGQALAAVGSAGADSSATAELRWPVDLPYRYLTSNFMEYRHGRFHAGLDLKTGGQTGYAVRAAEDGYVSRLRASGRGYGRALYLHGRSGRTYVYAHLERFGDRARSLVRAEQVRNGRYRADFYLAPHRMPVAKGEILALSGQSGTNGPHLHFEVRDGEQRPLNPLRFFAVPDTIAPIIEQIRAVPASVTATIEGRREAHLLKATRRSGLPDPLPVITISGAVAFAARVVDHSDPMRHKLEPYHVRLLLDEQEVYSSQNDRFTFAEQGQMRLEWRQPTQSRERWLYRRAANRLSGRSGTEWFRGADGQGLAVGEYRLTLIAIDFAGNRSERSWTVRVEDDSAQNSPESAATGRSGSHTQLAAEPLSPSRVAWRRAPVGLVWPDEPGVEALIRLTPLAGPRFVPDFDETTADSSLLNLPAHRVVELSPAAGDPVYEPIQLYSLPGRVDTASVAAAQALRSDGQALWYLAGDWPLRAPISVPLPGGELPARVGGPAAQPSSDVGIYQFSGKHWSYAGRPVRAEAGDDWILPLANPGLYAIMRDDVAPEIECWDQPLPVAHSEQEQRHGVHLPVWKLVSVGISDAGAGIDSETIQVNLAGENLIAEPDLPRGRVLIELPDELPAGEYLLGIEVADRAGNVAESTLPLVLR